MRVHEAFDWATYIEILHEAQMRAHDVLQFQVIFHTYYLRKENPIISKRFTRMRLSQLQQIQIIRI